MHFKAARFQQKVGLKRKISFVC